MKLEIGKVYMIRYYGAQILDKQIPGFFKRNSNKEIIHLQPNKDIFLVLENCPDTGYSILTKILLNEEIGYISYCQINFLNNIVEIK